MSTAPDQPRPPVHPRPGVVKTLGVCNVVFSVLTGLCLFGSTAWLVAMMSGRAASLQVRAAPSAQPTPPSRPQTKPMAAFNAFMGADDPKFTRFCFIDAGTGLVVNGIMFATGIGLLNLRRWGARWWTPLAWVKIVRLFLLWGFYIVAVAPSFSASMARNVVAMIQQQSGGRPRMPSVGDLTRVYSIMNLIVAVGMIGFGSIYPAISLWVLGRPGVKAAFIDQPMTERELP